ncbi:hypothetical protein [Amycolatopsis sp. EV170708-02-1]|uniref:hypothetical protein n=1 Tax=Amycolatopsis sp. EV170708-02-1 TaxID=2919322 RepID=UPI001F0C41BA|nr:hypothetical protein [Amycolatopsis sp. EV170708-02-1]UMP04743.1 hypothetical protein MJQ72_07875 [Amycolatopsis sp. EV170708-02-1]
MTTLALALPQFLLAATFFAIPVVGARRGTAAQREAESELIRQGVPATVLTRYGIDFGATRGSFVLAVAIGVLFAVLATLNLAGDDMAETLTWIFQPIVLVLGCLIMPGEVFVVRGIRSTFRKSGDAVAQGIDVEALVAAVRRRFPGWLPHVILARFVLATLGSALVLVLLATSSG